jgi:hypothetical protein
VVKLDAARLFARGRCESPDTRCVYVGSTALDPQDRFLRHKRGWRAAAIVRDYGIGLRHGMTKGPFPTRPIARREERRVHNRLAHRKGYKVWGDKGRAMKLSAKAGTR